MTERYDWNPMPHKVEVCCPSCSGFAIFEFAEVVKIQLKKDVIFFQENKLFEYEMFKDSCGHKWHGAIYYAGLHGGNVSVISQLPEGYLPENWSHSKYLYRNHGSGIGSIQCKKCNLSQKHTLLWPEESYFSISYKGEQLWAFNRESAIELMKYINSKDRETKNYKWSSFLLHVPSVFKKQRAREYVTKHLNKLLIC